MSIVKSANFCGSTTVPSLTLHLNPVSFTSFLERLSSIPVDEIRSRLSNGVLQRSCDCEGRAYTQAEAKDTTVQLPQTILESISAAQTLDSSPGSRHGSLV